MITIIDQKIIVFQGSCENIPAGYEAVSLIEALNGPYTPRATVLPPESPDTPDTDTASATQAAEVLNRYVLKKTIFFLLIVTLFMLLNRVFNHFNMHCRSAERTPVSKHALSKDSDSSPRTSSTPCPTPEFRMSVLLAKGENSGSQKDLHNRSPATRNKSSSHPRDKSNLRTRDTLRLVNEKQPVSLYEVRNVIYLIFYCITVSYLPGPPFKYKWIIAGAKSR